jgi:hypothetical protein
MPKDLEAKLKAKQRKVNLAALGTTAVLAYMMRWQGIDFSEVVQSSDEVVRFLKSEIPPTLFSYLIFQGLYVEALSMTKNKKFSEFASLLKNTMKTNLKETLNLDYKDEAKLLRSQMSDDRAVVSSIKEKNHSEFQYEDINKLFASKYRSTKGLSRNIIFDLIYEALTIPVNYTLIAFKKKKNGLTNSILEQIVTNHHLTRFAWMNKTHWNKLIQVEPSLDNYALRAIFESTRGEKRSRKPWKEFIEQLEKDNLLEDKFQTRGDYRNEVFTLEFSKGLKIVLKRNEESDVIEREYQNLKKLFKLDHVVLPGTTFENNGYHYLVTVHSGENNFYEVANDMGYDERFDLLRKASSQVSEIHRTSKKIKELENVLEDEPLYFLKRADIVSEKLNLDTKTRDEINKGFHIINDKLHEIAEDSELRQYVMALYGDMNTKNLILESFGDETLLKECDFESNYLLPVLIDYVSLWEFERNYIDYEDINQAILEDIAPDNPEIREKIKPYLDFARVQRHWELIGYRNRDLSKNDEKNNIAYEFYHKKMTEDALDRLIRKDHDELMPLEKALFELDILEYFV